MIVSLYRLLATRIVEIKDHKVIDFQGTYDEYITDQERAAQVA